jgi:raffinose/stachyose/melibiose transport system substrate-binding protein
MNPASRGVLCAFAAGIALTACSSNVSSGGSTSSSSLRIAAPASEKAAMDAVVAAFKKANPGTGVTVTYADSDPYQSTLRTQLSSGTAPDVFFAWPGNGNPGAIAVLGPQGYLDDLSGRPWAARIPQGMRSVSQIDGKTYILPVTYTGIGAIYNKKTLADVGKTEPKTWSQVLELCDAAKAKGKVAFALGDQTPWVTQMVDYALVATTVYTPNPDFNAQQAAGKAQFSGSGWKTAMDKYLEMNKRGCFSKDPLGTSVDEANRQVGQGDAVAAVQVLAVTGQIQSTAPAGTGFGMFPLPATDNPADTRMPGAAGGAYAVNAKSGKKALGEKFIDFMAEPQNMNLYASKDSAAPALPNDTFRPDPAFAPLLAYQKENRTVPFMDQLWPNPKVQQVHLSGVQDLLSGRADPDSVLKQMDSTYKAG